MNYLIIYCANLIHHTPCRTSNPVQPYRDGGLLTSSAYHLGSKIAKVAEKQLGWLTVNNLGPRGELGTAHLSRGRHAGA